MGVFRIYPDKSNCIASGVYSNFNSGQNAVVDFWYGGGGTDTSLERRRSVSRFIIKFDLKELIDKFDSKEINRNLVSSYRLRMTNAVPGDRILEPEYEFDVLDKKIAASFDLITFPINKDWDEGRGYDLYQENYLVKQRGNPLYSGYSNWNSASLTSSWDAPGVYTDPLGSTYSGETIQMGMTISAFLEDTNFLVPTYFNFTTSANTSITSAVTSIMVGNDFLIQYNPLSGNVSTQDWADSLNSTSFSGIGISISGQSSTTYVSNSTFTLSADTPTSNVNYHSTQHFDLGNENIDMDVTSIVNDWLNGGSQNNGLGIAYRRDYELLSTDTRYVSSFYTENTNSAFKPYIEVVYNQSFQDDRLQVSNNRISRLFLYTFSGNNSINYHTASTVSVDIQTMAGTPVYTGLTPTHQENGVYYVDVFMSGATPGEQYKDVWRGVTFVPGIDQQDITQSFTVRGNYYLSSTPQVNDYSISVYGIGDNSILHIGETHKVFVDLRVNYSSRNQPETAYDLKYRVVMNNQIEVIPWTSVNQAVINKCKNNYFVLETGWLLSNQSYRIEYRVDEFGTKRVMPNSTVFKVIRPDGF